MSREYADFEPRHPHERALSARAEKLVVAALALTLLIPCLWLPYVQAGDLASHVYNAWLAGQVKSGAVQGLAIVHPWTNVLVDVLLAPIFEHAGRSVAERVIAGASVEIFFWACFYLIFIVNGRRSWLIAPSIAMLAWGMMFELGFLNFYVASGLAIWILALLWQPSGRRIAISAVLAAIACFGNVLPVAWALACAAYVNLARKLPASRRVFLLCAGVAGLFLLQAGLLGLFEGEWRADRILSVNMLLDITGLQQVWIFGKKYLIVAVLLAVIWFQLFLERLDEGGMADDPAVHLWWLNAAAVVILPSTLLFPMYALAFSLIPERFSLFTAALFCAVVARGRHGRSLTRLSALAALIYFGSLFQDLREYNNMEARLTNLVSQLPPGQRVVASVSDRRTNLNGLAHIADAACIGRCYSYGNYEPASRQFRLRATAPNQVVASDIQTVLEIEHGEHTVTPEEAPLYSVCPGSQEGDIQLRRIETGQKTCHFEIPLTFQPF